METPAAPVPPLADRLHDFLFFTVSAEHRAEFECERTFANFHRAGIFLFVIGFLAAAISLPLDLLHWRAEGYWGRNPAFVTWFHLHVFLVAFAAIYGALLYVNRIERPEDVRRRHGWLVQGYVVISFAALLGISLVQQRLTGSMVVYILAVTLYASVFYTGPWESLVVLGLNFAVMAWLLPLFQADHLRLVEEDVAMFSFFLCFWIVSRIIYSLKAGDFTHLHTIARQTANLAEANLNLATVNRELAEANRLKARLIAIAAHDLRDPLHTLGGLASALGEETAGLPAAQPLVQGMTQLTRRMGSLVENLLTDAEADAGHIILQKAEADLDALIADVLALRAPLASAKRLSLHFTPAGAGRACIDAPRFQQVIDNLVGNAIKYSPPGRDVWITRAAETGGGQRLTVRDEGPGLAPGEETRIFERFQRGRARPTAGEPSTGLGLSITKHLAELHGGRIWAENAGPAGGASFIVTLPG